ncbi:hypothetical protein PCANC_28692, partial [Puccinia coronata f. sp. avenae]
MCAYRDALLIVRLKAGTTVTPSGIATPYKETAGVDERPQEKLQRDTRYIYNRIPNSKVKTCPLQKLYGVEPDPNALYPFGAKALVQIPAERRTKLDERAEHGRLIGYPEEGGGLL